MKRHILLVLSCFFIFSNCSLDGSNSTVQKLEYYWHLIRVTGGIAGVDERFNTNTIVWSFDEDTSMLTVENNNTDNSIEDGLDSGTYRFSILDIDAVTYLTVDGDELGSFVVNQSTFTLDQNRMSTGTGTDGYIYLFQLETRAVTGN